MKKLITSSAILLAIAWISHGLSSSSAEEASAVPHSAERARPQRARIASERSPRTRAPVSLAFRRLPARLARQRALPAPDVEPTAAPPCPAPLRPLWGSSSRELEPLACQNEDGTLTSLRFAWGTGAARGDTASIDDARSIFADSQDAFADGDYDVAGDLFLETFRIHPFPEFLWNAAIAFERAGECGDAIHYYNEYLGTLPGGANAEDAVQRLDRLLETCEARGGAGS